MSTQRPVQTAYDSAVEAPGGMNQQDPTVDTQEIKRLVLDRVNEFNDYRKQRLISIKANIAYLCGNQNIALQNDTIVQLPDSETTLCCCNLILPAVVNDIATATKVPATFDIIPSSQSESDQGTAIASRKILDYILRTNPRNLSRGETVLWYDLDGVGWRKVYWNTSGGILGTDPETGQPVPDGEVSIECIPNNELIFDYRIKNLNKIEWIIHAKRVSVGWIRARYGQDFADKMKDVSLANEQEESFEASILHNFKTITQRVISDSPVDNQRDSRVKDDRLVDYYEYWHKPSMSNPEGSLVILAGGEVLKAGPYPKEAYPHQKLPFVPASPMELKGITVGSIPRIGQARPMQREYNIIRSLIMSHTHALGNGVIFTPRESNLQYKTLSNLAGSVIEYDGIAKPHRDQGVPLPNSIFVHLSEIRRNIDEVFAFHEPSKGMMPSGGPKSAIGIEVLKSADYDQLGPVIDALEEAEEKIVYQALSLALANYREGKTLNIVGPDNRWTTFVINKEKLDGKINVIVRRGSSVPSDKQSESAQAFNAWQSGLLGDPMLPGNRLHTLKQMQLPGIDHILQINAMDTEMAKREFVVSDRMLRETPQEYDDITDPVQLEEIMNLVQVPEVNSFDDHEIHAYEHRRFIVEHYHEYKSLDAKYVYAMAMMIEHMNVHLSEIQNRQAMASEESTQNEAYVKGNTAEQLIIQSTDYNPDGSVKVERTDND